MTGRFYEDFSPGDVIVHAPSRTITETDNVLFCSITMNPQPLHLDHEFAKSTVHGQPVVNGILTLALTLGLSVQDTTMGTTAGNLGFGKITYHSPVFVGDTITAETRVVSKRLSKSRPDMGIVEFEHIGRKQDGSTTMTCERAGLILRSPEAARSGGRADV